MIKKRSELAKEKVLEILSKYPKGLGFNELYRIYKEKEGKNAVSNPVFLDVIKKLKEEGKIVIEDEGWIRGRKKIIKLPSASEIAAKKLTEIKTLKRIFEEYLGDRLSELEASSDYSKISEILQEINAMRAIVLSELEKLKKEILSLNTRDDFKKDLLLEISRTEQEINQEFIKEVYERYKGKKEPITMLFEIYQKAPAYANFLRDCIKRKKNLLDCILELASREGLEEVVKENLELIKPILSLDVHKISPEDAKLLLDETRKLFEKLLKDIERIDLFVKIEEARFEFEKLKKKLMEE